MASSWERLGSTTLGSAGDQIDVTIAAKKYLKITCFVKSDGLAKARIRFNDDSGSNYIYRAQVDGGSTEAGSAADFLIIDNHNISSNETYYCTMNFINVSDKKKVGIIEYVNNDEDGAGNAPKRGELSGVWANTSAQIVKVSLINPSAGSYRADSTVTVWGTDDQPTTPFYPNLANGAIFEQSDDGKHYMFDGTSAWNEM